MPFCKARLKAVRFVAARAGYACGLTVLLLVFGSQSPAKRRRRRRHPHHLAAPHPYRRRHHHHLQARRPLRRGRAGKAQLVPARLAQGRSDQDGSAPDRPGVGGAARGRQQGADLGGMRLSFAGRPTPCCATAAAGVARFSQHMLGRAMDFYIPGVPLERNSRHRIAAAARRRRLLSDVRLAVRPHGYRQRADVAAHDAASSWCACSRTARPCISRPTAARCRAMRWRSPRSGSAATILRKIRSKRPAMPAWIRGAMVASKDRHGINPIAKLFGLRKGEEDDDADSYASRRGAGSRRDHAHQSKAVAVAARRTGESGRDQCGGADQADPHQRIRRRGRPTPAAQKVAPPPQTDDRFACAARPNQVITRARLLAGPA